MECALARQPKMKHSEANEPIRDQILTSRIYRLVASLRRSRALASRRSLGLTGFDWILLMRVGEAEPVMLVELAAWLGIDKGQASRAVNNIIKMGLVRRRGSRGEIELTPQGRRLCERGAPLSRTRHQTLLVKASKTELNNFAKVFPTLLDNAKSMLVSEWTLRQD
jgi:DNA-binding MarR family transcriptional regulator